MRQAGWVLLSILLLLPASLRAQSTVDALEKELNDVEKQHDEANTEVMKNFLDQLEAASGSPEAAIALYQAAGGYLPDPTPVADPNDADNERQDAKASRLSQDQDNLARLATMVQFHCTMMRFAGQLAAQPDKKDLKDDWIAWLKTAAQSYGSLRGTGDLKASPPDTGSGGEDPPDRPRRHRGGGGGGGEKGKAIGEWKNISMRDSIIGKYLNFHAWADKEQGAWAIKGIPALYRAQILDPLRKQPTAETLAAWDVLISMLAADQTDQDRWSQVDLPTLTFDRACDDYAVNHSMEKLQVITQLAKANPTHPRIKEMFAKAHELLADYKSRQSGATVADAPKTDSNVTVEKQGDMTIITTKNTNTVDNPAPPAPPPAPPPAQ